MADVVLVGEGHTTYATRQYTTIPKPAGIASGDHILYALLVGTTGTPSTPTVVPAGFSIIAGPISRTSGGFSVKIWLYAKRAGSSEPATYEFGQAGTGENTQGWLAAYRNVHDTTPLDVTPTTNTGVGNPATFLGLTATVAGVMLVAFMQDWGDTANNLTPPTGFTERTDLSIVYMAEKLLTVAGATGNATMNNNSSSTNPWQTILVGLRPVASAPPVTGHRAKVWNGTAWVTRPVYVWNGSAWIPRHPVGS